MKANEPATRSFRRTGVRPCIPSTPKGNTTMATANQIAANRANAQKSTGPRTEEGKAKSCLNHLSHGFASSATVMPGEDPQEFIALHNDLAAEHQPATPTEQ